VNSLEPSSYTGRQKTSSSFTPKTPITKYSSSKVVSPNGPFKNSSITPISVNSASNAYTIPVRTNGFKYSSSSSNYSSTPRNNRDERDERDRSSSTSPHKYHYSSASRYNSNNTYENEHNRIVESLYSENIIKSSDSRLLMPAINLESNNNTTINNNNNNASYSNKTSNNNSPRSIIDESRSLLREYEQLRNDSVSEIQRAHDSLNARFVSSFNNVINMRNRPIFANDRQSVNRNLLVS
jgi:hypothetical protein